MKFSLLHKIKEEANPCDIIYNLSADRIIAAVSNDVKKNDYFLTILKNPLVGCENIIYRQEIVRDLTENEGLLSDLKLVFIRYDKIKQDWRESRANAVPVGASGNAEAMLEYTFASLQVTAMFPKTIISFYNLIYETLKKYNIKSEALTSIRDYCLEMTENDSLAEIDRISSLFRYYTVDKFTYGVTVSTDDALRAASCELCSIDERKVKNENSFWKKLLPGKKDTADSPIKAGEDARDDAYYLLNEALSSLDNLLTQITDSIYESFFGLSRELAFYETALELIKYLTDLGLPMSMPSIRAREDDIFFADTLYDLLLATDGRAANEVIPNNVDIASGADGLLVRGKNNSGKTVFLRSVGIAQLMAQAGLPICAKFAEISVRTRIFAHFSSAEEAFVVGDTAGRFEGEVKEIARIIDAIKPYSLVLLNETFQTTAYSEGADGMYDILSAMPDIKTKYIFVTHLTKLFDLFGGSNVKLAETDPESRNFKINLLN